MIGMIMKMWRAWWWAWSSILKVLKVTSLQCLYNISKKKLWMEFILEFIKIKTSTSWYRFLMKTRHDQSTEKKKFVRFLQYIKKKYRICICVLFNVKHSDTWWGSSHDCCYLFLGGSGEKLALSFRSWSSEIWSISREWIDKMSWFFFMLIQI